MTNTVDRSRKLTDEETVQIRTRAAAGEGYPVLAEAYGVSRKTISAIAVGRIRPDLGGPRVRKGRWGDLEVLPDPHTTTPQETQP